MNQNHFRNIIIIDDDVASRVLARIIVKEENIADRVLTFTTADEGMRFILQSCLNGRAAAEACPDLILLDLNMPGKDGFDFLTELEKLQQENVLCSKVAILTSSENKRDLERAAAFQVHAYLQKPVSEETVKSLIGTKAD
ncbi:MAG: response regulator [Cytophagales bacterium]|nr:response regulator [Cytophagales bacterium]